MSITTNLALTLAGLFASAVVLLCMPERWQSGTGRKDLSNWYVLITTLLIVIAWALPHG